MYYTIHSDKLNCDLTFFVPDEGGYLWVRIGNQPRRHACAGGDPDSISIHMSFRHTTETERERQFHWECDRWYRSFITMNNNLNQ